jgi:DNA-directed RNA polymerase subunit beta'
MAFSGARGNLSQVRQLVGMRGLMSDPSGEIMKLPIKKKLPRGLNNNRLSNVGIWCQKRYCGYCTKTANSGYLTSFD